jgi:hypothetical protein
MLKLIHQHFAVLSQVLSMMQWLFRLLVPPPRASFDPRRVSSLRPYTLLLYQQETNRFMDYVEVRGCEFRMAWELDRLLVQYSAEVRLSKSRLERLASATDLVFPQFRGQLVEIHQILKQWRKACPAKHTVPLPLRLVYGLAWLLAGKGFPRVGAALLMQYCFGLRPGELLQLVREDLIPASMAGSNRAMLTLGAKRGTKVGRRQCALSVGPGSELGQLLVSAF